MRTLTPHPSAGDFFPAVFNCPHGVERLGALGDGGQRVFRLSRIVDKPDCVIYSFGRSRVFLVMSHFPALQSHTFHPRPGLGVVLRGGAPVVDIAPKN